MTTDGTAVSNKAQKAPTQQSIDDHAQADLNKAEHLNADIDPESAEYKNIYIKLFGSLPHEAVDLSEQEAPCVNSETPQTLTIFDHSVLAELSERMSIGREERKFYSALDPKHAQKPLIEPTDEALIRFQQLFLDFPNASELLQYVYDFLCLRKISSKKAIYMSPVLITGDPGIGKTAVIKAICQTLGVDHGFVAISSCTSNGLLAGQSSNWSGSSIGAVLKKLLYGTCANPILQLDELDKAVVNHNVNPYLALYTLLERPQMYQFVDEFASNLPVDASYTMFFATANDLSPIPPAILSRFRIIHQDAPTQAQMRKIVANQYRMKCDEEGVETLFPTSLDDEVVDYLASKTPRESGLMLARAIAAATSRSISQQNGSYEIQFEDLSDCQPLDRNERGIGFVWQS
jgi:ATP-dependent Lon protease